MSKKSLEKYGGVDYKQVWIDVNGPIPKDKKGRPYQIHHLGGIKTDNRLENLIAMPRSWHIVWHRLIKNLPLQILFRLADGLMSYVIAEQKRIDKCRDQKIVQKQEL